MRVALDTNGLYTTQAGVARYLRGLVRGLHRVNAPDAHVFPLAWAVESFSYQQPHRAVRTFYREFIWARWAAPRLVQAMAADLLHSTGGLFMDPPHGVRHVVTLHDLACWRYPERFRTWQRWSGKRGARRILQADRVICISQFTADEAMQLLGLPAGRIDIVSNGCDFHRDEPVPTEQASGGAIPSEFFLFVGSLEPVKNLVLLKAAYELGRAQGRALPPLVIVGARWEGVSTEGVPPEDWIYLGRQSDAVLVYLYRRALALVFPSKYEGFGLPVAEAMALGCPVICSRVASLPEVGGEAVLYAEQNPESYTRAMERLLKETGMRPELIHAGHEQARRFSWRRCAAETLGVYREVMR